MVSGAAFAEQAKSEKYNNLKYDKCDCQAFVEKVLYDSGCRKSDGSAYNWRGSNSMWRNALSWKGTKQECIDTFGSIPLGAWVFIVKNDGGEKEKGYNDKEGNASHVGIYTGDDLTRDSTRNSSGRNGVGYRPLKDWNRVGLCKYLDYNSTNKDNKEEAKDIINYFRSLLDILERMITE